MVFIFRANVTQKKWDALIQAMKDSGVQESDLQESFVMGGGKGGQKANKTANKVVLKHLPTGSVVSSAKSRSRDLNRFYARRLLCQKLNQATSLSDDIVKLRKQKKRRKARAQSKLSDECSI